MKKSPLKKVSTRQKLINEILKIKRQMLIIERGARCELCGKEASELRFGLSLFHILDRKRYPKIQLLDWNLLLACWCPAKWFYMPYCHNIFHHDSGPSKDKIEAKIKELRTPDYRDRLLIADKSACKLTEDYLGVYLYEIKRQYKKLLEKENGEV